MKKIVAIFAVIFAVFLNLEFGSNNAYAKAEKCISPIDGMIIQKNTTFCSGIYNLPNGIQIGADDVILNMNGAVFLGNSMNGNFDGIKSNKSNLTIMNGTLKNYVWALHIQNSAGGNIIRNMVFVQNTSFDIMFEQAGSNNQIINNEISGGGNGIYLNHVSNSIIKENSISNNSAYGILLYYSNNNKIKKNIIQDCGTPGLDYVSGISLAYVNYGNIITKNILKNNMPRNIGLRGRYPDELPAQNKIWKNDIYTTNIVDENESNNIYCVNHKGNNYFDGATGPTCN